MNLFPQNSLVSVASGSLENELCKIIIRLTEENKSDLKSMSDIYRERIFCFEMPVSLFIKNKLYNEIEGSRVKLIDDGMSQRNIAKRLGLSLCKITRGSKELKKDNSAFKHFIELYKEKTGK